MPRYREPLWIETVIDNLLTRLSAALTSFANNTPLKYWPLTLEGTLVLALAVWLVYTSISSFTRAKVSKSKYAHLDENMPSTDTLDTPFPPQSPPINPLRKTAEETPLMKELAPPGHQPTNAQLCISPFHIRNRFAEREGQVTELEYQTSFAKWRPGRGVASMSKNGVMD
ncbi:hypothetical protein EK21DRAFT_117238 [Setomelanomma holmii]|uniref:Uncharacterized protein n=1 Tax=Setomelanomma holmii TaxID=210430 RepID=A0A9P4GYG5_9PLEO|nr:hypothetical protein EK21DRAFT_117238 [Setomelanomma holmii]